MKGTTLKTRPELRLFQGAGLMCRDPRIGLGPSGFEPESSGPEPPRIDQATPRTRVTRGRSGVTIRVARGCVSILNPSDSQSDRASVVLLLDTQRRDLISEASDRCAMDQLQMEPRARKKKKSSKLEFDASQVFGTSKDTEIQMDLDSARYAAQKGEGGDRRA